MLSSNSDQPVAASQGPGSKEEPLYWDTEVCWAYLPWPSFLVAYPVSIVPFTNKTNFVCCDKLPNIKKKKKKVFFEDSLAGEVAV